jgi:hypothetical protein
LGPRRRLRSVALRFIIAFISFAVVFFSGLTAFHGVRGLTLPEAFLGSYDDVALFVHCPGSAETLRNFVARDARENALFRLAKGVEGKPMSSSAPTVV